MHVLHVTTEEQHEERRESQRVRYLTSQHSPMQKDQLQHDSHMWLDWARSNEVKEREEQKEEKSEITRNSKCVCEQWCTLKESK